MPGPRTTYDVLLDVCCICGFVLFSISLILGSLESLLGMGITGWTLASMKWLIITGAGMCIIPLLLLPRRAPEDT